MNPAQAAAVPRPGAARVRAQEPFIASAPAIGGPGLHDDQASRLRAIVNVFERGAVPAAAPAREAVAFDDPAPPARRPHSAPVVTISSGKGGVGKTNTCVNLAIALASLGHRVTLVDADLGMANADVLCGLSPTRRLEEAVGVAGGPRRAAPRPRSLADLAVDAPGGFRLVPGSVGVAQMADLDTDARSRLIAGLAELERDADIILVDTGAGMSCSVVSLVREADLAMIVTTPEPTAVTDAYALIKSVLARDGRRAAARTQSIALVVNEAVGEREAAGVHARIAGVCARFLGYDLPLLGRITRDERVPAAVRKRTPLLLDSPRSPAARDLAALAAAVSATLNPARTRATRAHPRRGVSAIFADWFGR